MRCNNIVVLTEITSPNETNKNFNTIYAYSAPRVRHYIILFMLQFLMIGEQTSHQGEGNKIKRLSVLWIKLR